MSSQTTSMRARLPRLLQPREIAIKKGSLINLRFIEGRSAVLLSGVSSQDTSGGTAKIESYLKTASLDVERVNGISGDPTSASVRKVAEKLLDVAPDWIIACGGGSVLDCAKLAWAMYEHPGLEFTEYATPYTLPQLRSKARFIAIPTTGGSGSEASVAAVVTDESQMRRIPVVSEEFIPDLVILDPALTTSVSPGITVYTAIDAFTHAVESYCSTMNNQLTNSYAVMAGRMIVEHLQTAVSEPENLDAREHLQYAAMYGGIAQNMTSVGAAHALSHALGATMKIPHGLANTIVLPSVLRLNDETSPRPAMFADEIGLSTLDQLLEWLSQVSESAQLSLNWGQGLKPDMSIEPGRVAEIALKDVCLRTNPRKLVLENLLAILEKTK